MHHEERKLKTKHFWMQFFRIYREFSFLYERSPSARLARCSILISFDITSKIALQFLYSSTTLGLWENDERVRQGEKGVTLQAGKTDYSDCRRVRLAGWATPSFWQQRIPLVMSSNERASFIPRSRGVCTSIEKTKERERREDETERGEKKGGKTKIAKKRERRETLPGVEKVCARIMEYVGSEEGVRKRCQGCAWLKSMAVSSTGPANFLPRPKTTRVTTRDVNGSGSAIADAKGTYIGPRSSPEHEVREEFNLTESHMGLSNFSAWCASSSVGRDNRIAKIVRRIRFDWSGRLRVGDVMKIKTVVSKKKKRH